MQMQGVLTQFLKDCNEVTAGRGEDLDPIAQGLAKAFYEILFIYAVTRPEPEDTPLGEIVQLQFGGMPDA